jgi:hypothetical protein
MTAQATQTRPSGTVVRCVIYSDESGGAWIDALRNGCVNLEDMR